MKQFSKLYVALCVLNKEYSKTFPIQKHTYIPEDLFKLIIVHIIILY